MNSFVKDDFLTFQTRRGGDHLIVENLSPETDNEVLCSAFSPFGELESCNVVKDKITGKSKMYGIVSYFNENDADVAIEQMNRNPCYGLK